MDMDYRESPEGSRETQKGWKGKNKAGGQWRPSMSASLCYSLKKDNIINQPIVKGDVKSTSSYTPLLGYPRFRMDYTAGVFYLGKQRFSRAHWAYYLLPRWMQIQGRLAKEDFSIFNNAIWQTFSDGKKKYHVRKVCDMCDGTLLINNDGDYYCKECGLMLGERVLIPGYDSISQSTPMADHNYNI
jgi:hypothetical protein